MVKVIIIGGGFGGINAARALKHAPVDILLIDRVNHHVFQPLLYQVATAALSIGNIAFPIREILRDQTNAEVIMGEVEHINTAEKTVQLSGGKTYPYDYLIVACGAKQSYFGHDEWKPNAPGLKTISDAIGIREKMLLSFEKAEKCDDLELMNWYLRFVIVGGGPTGVEMAGSIAEFAHNTLYKNFRRLNPANSKIYLIEGADQLLPGYPRKLAEKAHQYLKDLRVDVVLHSKVTNITEEGVQIEGDFLYASTVIWAAGNQASCLLTSLNTPLDRQGRARVNADLTIPDHKNVFVIGDAACFLDKQGQSLPGIAPVAIQQGRYAAAVIKRDIAAKAHKPFVYFDKGMIATIGRGKAVAMFHKLQFSGITAWFIWCFVHIFYLISFSNRLLVMMQWIFLYLRSKRQCRVITNPADQT